MEAEIQDRRSRSSHPVGPLGWLSGFRDFNGCRLTLILWAMEYLSIKLATINDNLLRSRASLFSRDVAEIARPFCRECTTAERREPRMSPCSQMMAQLLNIRVKCSLFALITSRDNRLSLCTPLCTAYGKLAEGSDRSGPMIGFWAQGWNKKHFLRLRPLLGRNFQGKKPKSVVHLLLEK